MTTPDLRGVRLAVLAPISRPIPPTGYGPWEQIAANIAEGMVRRGLDVTVFATGNSQTTARLRSVIPVGLAQDRALHDDVYTSLHIRSVFAAMDEFDIIHNNFDWKPMTYAPVTTGPPLLTTIHGFSTPPILGAYYACAERSFYCSISNADRDPGLDYLATVYNGINPADFTFVPTPGDYLVFLGRFHEEKGAHLAIEIARRSGVRLIMAAIPQDEAYFREKVAPHIDGDRVQFIGAVDRVERDRLLGGALALVHMTTRPERFGLTMIEAMACGTPVLGARMGSVPEIVIDGVTGVVCADTDEAVQRLGELAKLERLACRRHVENTFTIEHMIDGYLQAYARCLALGTPPPPTPQQLAARAHDWWDRPMAFTDLPPRPQSLAQGAVGTAPC